MAKQTHGEQQFYVHYRGSWLRSPGPSAPCGRLLAASALATAVGSGLFVAMVPGLGSYGWTLFLGAPFVMGFVSTAWLNYRVAHRWRSITGALLASQGLVALLLLAFAMEGLICLAMAFPVTFASSICGALVATWFLEERKRGRGDGTRSAILVLVAIPLLVGGAAIDTRWPLRAVVTEIRIDAPPEAVWPHVIGFDRLPEPTEWIFRLGIAYPKGARLSGEGEGAVRYCEFSTGPFVEPITAWEPPHRLAFDVAAQPEPMHEWSPYDRVHAPHLLDGLVSKRGEFRLVPLAGGRTLLRGTTWYELRMGPQLYWTRWSDGIIHGIHRRVLRQIRDEAESAREGAGAEVL